jgi:5-methyltetrahydrofolate--homocysteine methyltransferase
MDKLSALLQAGKPILLDGAMGTMLFNAGLNSGDCPEEWNILHPKKIRQVHREYIEAGSQIILTNSFGGTSIRLDAHDLGDQAFEFNNAAAINARVEADAHESEVIVAGSIGPTGQILEPLGTLNIEDAQKSFSVQAAGLAAGGVDLFWIETMSDLEETKAAIAGVRSVSDLPIAVTMSFDTHGRTMMGVSPEKALEELQDQDIQFIGANCGTGSDELIEVIQAMVAQKPALPLIAKANAGIPEFVGDEVVYNGSPEVMADYAWKVWHEGARLIGGCCGNTPEHIRSMADALQEFDSS